MRRLRAAIEPRARDWPVRPGRARSPLGIHAAGLGEMALRRRMIVRTAAALALAAALAPPALAAPPKPDPALHEQALEILKRGIAFPTVAGRGQTPAYAAYLKG